MRRKAFTEVELDRIRSSTRCRVVSAGNGDVSDDVADFSNEVSHPADLPESHVATRTNSVESQIFINEEPSVDDVTPLNSAQLEMKTKFYKMIFPAEIKVQ